MGLNDDYNSIRGNILMMNPLPSISQVYFMLSQEEKQREIRSSGHFPVNSASLTVESYKPSQYYREKVERSDTRFETFSNMFERNEGKRPSLANLFCNYCKKPGYSIEKCYRLHGFPPNNKHKGARRTAALVQTNGQEGTSSMNDCYYSLNSNNVAVPGLTPE